MVKKVGEKKKKKKKKKQKSKGKQTFVKKIYIY